jgi:hypothetical protein
MWKNERTMIIRSFCSPLLSFSCICHLPAGCFHFRTRTEAGLMAGFGFLPTFGNLSRLLPPPRAATDVITERR